jgi:hypothetical protein
MVVAELQVVARQFPDMQENLLSCQDGRILVGVVFSLVSHLPVTVFGSAGQLVAALDYGTMTLQDKIRRLENDKVHCITLVVTSGNGFFVLSSTINEMK